MNKSLFSKYIIPFIEWYGLFIVLAIVIDYFLHRFQLHTVGYYLGIAGTLLIIFSFIYSLRKRKIITIGSPKGLLQLHEILSWLGATLILVHAGIHFNALLPWLAIFMMLIAVGSGLTGKFLLIKASDTLKEKKNKLLKKGFDEKEVDKKLFLDSTTLLIMKKWREVHLPITLVFAILSLLHIISIFMFSK